MNENMIRRYRETQARYIAEYLGVTAGEVLAALTPKELEEWTWRVLEIDW